MFNEKLLRYYSNYVKLKFNNLIRYTLKDNGFEE